MPSMRTNVHVCIFEVLDGSSLQLNQITILRAVLCINMGYITIEKWSQITVLATGRTSFDKQGTRNPRKIHQIHLVGDFHQKYLKNLREVPQINLLEPPQSLKTPEKYHRNPPKPQLLNPPEPQLLQKPSKSTTFNPLKPHQQTL